MKVFGALGETKHQREHEHVELAEVETAPANATSSAKITRRIEELGDWRGETLAHVRQRYRRADPDIEEEWKWEKPKSPGTPVWSHDGIVCTGESYKQVVKLTFAREASIQTRRSSSIPVSKATCGVRSTSVKERDGRNCLQATHPCRGWGRNSGSARAKGGSEQEVGAGMAQQSQGLLESIAD